MSKDPREAALNEVTRRILVRDNYDPHFCTIEQWVVVEDRLFLARFDMLCKMIGVDPATFLHMLANPTVVAGDTVCLYCRRTLPKA
jgi:hypothetical protein